MAITDIDMFSGLTKLETAIELIVAWEPLLPYEVADSGGKDSGVVVKLTQMAEARLKLKPDYVYCVSPIDPPEIHQFLKEHRPDTQWHYHARGFFNTVVRKSLPMRQARWCCTLIKEASGEGRTVILGNRSTEGTIRKNQKCYEKHRNPKKNKIFLRPIITWTEAEVWEFHKYFNLPYCSLYDEGSSGPFSGDGQFRRLGCVLCPFSREVEKEIARFPKIAKLWMLACDRIVADRQSRGNWYKNGKKKYKQDFKTGQEMFDWWIQRD